MKHNNCLTKNILINSKTLTLVFITVFLLFTQICGARDLSSGVKEIESQLSSIMYIAGPVAFMISAAMFYFSRQLGMDRLMAAVIGTVVFMASKTLFVFLERAFH
jgi:hypothetical protein